MVENMKKKYIKYWGIPEEMNKLFFIASILDPRNNLAFVGDSLEDIYRTKGFNLKDEVETYMNIYCKVCNKILQFISTYISLSNSSSETTGISSPKITFVMPQVPLRQTNIRCHKDLREPTYSLCLSYMPL